jgi:hypothetical protein
LRARDHGRATAMHLPPKNVTYAKELDTLHIMVRFTALVCYTRRGRCSCAGAARRSQRGAAARRPRARVPSGAARRGPKISRAQVSESRAAEAAAVKTRRCAPSAAGLLAALLLPHCCCCCFCNCICYCISGTAATFSRTLASKICFAARVHGTSILRRSIRII